MSEKVIIITGANRGIGKETARELAMMGARIIFACRSEERTLEVIKELKKETLNERLEYMHLDLADFNSIKRFVMQFKPKYQRLDILINNAGCYRFEYYRTKDGFETNFQINVLGPFLLTTLLLDILMQTPFSRVINVGSQVHTNVAPETFFIDEMNEIQTFNGSWVNGQYAKSKLAMIMFTKELARKMKNIRVMSVNPGTVNTGLYADFMNSSLMGLFYKCLFPVFDFFLKDENQGAQTTLYCALEQFDRLVQGGNYGECKIQEISYLADNKQAQQMLWDSCINWVDLT